MYFVHLYWKSITEHRALSRFASALLFDAELLQRQCDDFQGALKAMPAKDAATLAKAVAEKAVDPSLVSDKTAKPAEVHEALMATKAQADSS